MRVLLTGANGTLGREIARTLLSSTEHDLVAATSLPKANALAAWAIPTSLMTRASVIPRAEASKYLLNTDNHVDVVVNAGWPRAQGGRALAEGLAMQRAFLHAARRADRVVNISSQSVYSPARTRPAQEGDPLDLSSPYATAKYSVELLADSVLPKPALHVRLASLVSVSLPARVVNRFVATALAGQPITITGGKQVFDFMDARDAATAIVSLATETATAPTGPINVGSDSALTLADIAAQVVATVEAQTNLHVPIEVHAGGQHFSNAIDTARLHRTVQFSPSYRLEDLITELVNMSRKD